MLHDHTLLNHGIHSTCIPMQSSSFNKAVSCALSKVGNSRMALKDKQLFAIQHIYTARMCGMATDRYGKYTCKSLIVCICALHPFGKAEVAYRHADLQATFLHGVAAHCICIFLRIFLHVIIICKFSLHIDELYRECRELLVHARTVATPVSVFWPSGGASCWLMYMSLIQPSTASALQA